jgi:hypothetical protein
MIEEEKRRGELSRLLGFSGKRAAAPPATTPTADMLDMERDYRAWLDYLHRKHHEMDELRTQYPALDEYTIHRKRDDQWVIVQRFSRRPASLPFRTWEDAIAAYAALGRRETGLG